MTSPVNARFADKGFGYVYPIDSTGSYDINAGDLVWMDTSAHVIKPADTDAHMAYLVGYAYDSSFLNLYGTKKYDPGVVAVCTGVGKFKTTAGDTYHHGDTLYLGADAQTVTNTVGGNTHPIGYVYLPFGGTVSGATGTMIEAIIQPQFPTTGVA